jgi:hypothetical protein
VIRSESERSQTRCRNSSVACNAPSGPYHALGSARKVRSGAPKSLRVLRSQVAPRCPAISPLVTKCGDSATYSVGGRRSVPMKGDPHCQPTEAAPMNDIRELVTTTLNRLGLGNARSLGEQLVCCDNCRVGVRFAFDGVSAIWLDDASHVRFVDDSGKLIKVVRCTTRREVVGKVA